MTKRIGAKVSANGAVIPIFQGDSGLSVVVMHSFLRRSCDAIRSVAAPTVVRSLVESIARLPGLTGSRQQRPSCPLRGAV